jgi:hypothetical protein
MAFVPFGFPFFGYAFKGKPEGLTKELIIFVHHKHK